MVRADLVLLNGKVCTVDERFSFKEALAVKDGWIVDVGSTEGMRRYAGTGTKVIDLGGKLLLPGACDSHLHGAYAGLWLHPHFIDVDDSQVQDLLEMRRRIKEKADQVPPGTWLFGWGFKSSQLKEVAAQNRQVTRHDIDEACPDHPVMIADGGLHRVLVNSLGLEICGIDRDSPDLRKEVGVMIRDPLTGEPTGLFEDFGAHALVGKKAYHLSLDELEHCILRLQGFLNKYGITRHTDMAGVGGDHLFGGTFGSGVIHAYERLNRKGKLTARVSLEVLPGLDGIQSYDAITKGLDQTVLPEFHDENWVKARCVKIFGDDAWQRDGFAGPQGYCYFPGDTDEEQADNMRRTILEVHRRGWQMGIHLTGGKAADVAVDAFIEAQQMYPGKALRHFLIHGDKLTKDYAKKCVEHKIGLSSQASGGWRFGWANTEPLPREYLDSVCLHQRYTDMGLRIAQGSDGPALPMNWLLGLQFLVSRTNVSGELCSPELRCNLEDALRMYTINGAYQEHMEEVCGSVEPNKLADFQVLDEDLFSIPPEEIGQVRVLMTVVGGKVVYEA